MTVGQEEDTSQKLERLYNSTWLCTVCGNRNSLEQNVCIRCIEIEDSFNRSWLCE